MWWWKRKKLERLNEELTIVTLLNRVYASRTDLTRSALDAYELCQRRQSELLAEISQLNPTARSMARF
jgi:hypothetical protein